jgi:hypothetical protein
MPTRLSTQRLHPVIAWAYDAAETTFRGPGAPNLHIRRAFQPGTDLRLAMIGHIF